METKLAENDSPTPLTELAVADAREAVRILEPQLSVAARGWIDRQTGELGGWGAVAPRRLNGKGFAQRLLRTSGPPIDALALFYERFLQAYDPAGRKTAGVFYTPVEIVRFIVRGVDDVLRGEFGLAEGIAASEVAGIPLRILDPALGSGVFLTEIAVFLHKRFVEQGKSADAWNTFVAENLLPRLGGIEISPAAAYIAVVRLAACLAKTGYDFASPVGIELQVGDALAQPIRPAWPVVVGNPPFSGISMANQAWLQRLLHGQSPEGRRVADYFEVDGQPLNERKHWLQDDYVKFLRVAQDQIETAGVGIVALVTNHGYLDNVTFRGLRAALGETFSRISVVDLHGSAKRRERTPAGERDENVFGIEQGVAIGFLRRPPGIAPVSSHVERADLWGTRKSKLATLDMASLSELLPTAIEQQESGRAFVIVRGEACARYAAGWPLDEAMPLNSTAPVTARDRFVVAMELEELAERCRDFVDATISDDEIRERYFTRTRSPRYAPGDTRGWNLSVARMRMRAEGWQSLVKPVLYRPFDWRWMLWADWLIDWPRKKVMDHLLAGDNVALITRRQSPPNQPWKFVWITDTLTLDGVIRSDNCGSESVFPLWIENGGQRQANFAPRFLAMFHDAVEATFDAKQVFYFIYALLHAPSYRERYAAELSAGFPRIILPSSREVFCRLADLGSQLRALHCTRHTPQAQAPWQSPPDAVADFRVGSHQVCRKLQKDRGFGACQLPINQVSATLDLQAAIDSVLRNGITGPIPQRFSR